MSREALQESLSALMDNEADELEVRRILAAEAGGELHASWSRYNWPEPPCIERRCCRTSAWPRPSVRRWPMNRCLAWRQLPELHAGPAAGRDWLSRRR